MAVRWNPYVYAGANPVNHTDPSGAFFNIIAGAVGALVGGGFSGLSQMLFGGRGLDCLNPGALLAGMLTGLIPTHVEAPHYRGTLNGDVRAPGTQRVRPDFDLQVDPNLHARGYGPSAGDFAEAETRVARWRQTAHSEGWADARMQLETRTDVALGFRTNKDGTQELLEPFANQVNAAHVGQWEELGWMDPEIENFPDQFHHVLQIRIQGGARVKFNLDDVSITKVTGFDTNVTVYDADVRYTEWELHQILRDQRYYDATDFYIGGQQIPREGLSEWGLGFRGN